MRAQRRLVSQLAGGAALGVLLGAFVSSPVLAQEKPAISGTRVPSESPPSPPPSVSTDSSPDKHGYRRHRHPRWRSHWGFGWGWPYYGYWSYPWTYGGPAAWYGYPDSHRYVRADMGALDLDVWPETAEIYVDGQRVGTADDYDGFPTYLWLERGTYDVVIYKPGYETIARQHVVRPGLVEGVDDRLREGESVRPEDLVSKSTARRDERLRRDREREEEARRRFGADRDEDDGDWRDRTPRGGRDRFDDDRDRDASDDEELDVDEDDLDDRDDGRDGEARLRLRVEPEDASVYLDGRFVGTGRELAGAPSGLLLDGGEHTVEIVRPGHRSATRRFEVADGATVTLEIDLDEE